VDGHRADLVILKTARAHAAFEGRNSITDRDIALAAELALPHRIKRGPFYQAEISMEDLQERIEQLQGATTGSGEPEMMPDERQSESYEKKKR
jgi:Mg-chelatase subunit ChlI